VASLYSAAALLYLKMFYAEKRRAKPLKKPEAESSPQFYLDYFKQKLLPIPVRQLAQLHQANSLK